MDSHSHADIKKSIRGYMAVFVALMTLTIITVAISSLHLSVGAAVTLALCVATIKAGLVASYFMHLISEKKIIYATLILTVVFFVVLLFMPVLHSLDPLVS